jgi:hypothetical protein
MTRNPLGLPKPSKLDHLMPSNMRGIGKTKPLALPKTKPYNPITAQRGVQQELFGGLQSVEGIYSHAPKAKRPRGG